METQVIVVVRGGVVQEVHSIGESVVVAVLDYDEQASGGKLVELHDTGILTPDNDEQGWIQEVEAEEYLWAEYLADQAIQRQAQRTVDNEEYLRADSWRGKDQS